MQVRQPMPGCPLMALLKIEALTETSDAIYAERMYFKVFDCGSGCYRRGHQRLACRWWRSR